MADAYEISSEYNIFTRKNDNYHDSPHSTTRKLYSADLKNLETTTDRELDTICSLCEPLERNNARLELNVSLMMKTLGARCNYALRLT